MANEFPNDAALTLMTAALIAEVTHIQLHSGDPGAAGTANVIAGVARQPITLTPDADGDFSLGGTVVFTGGTPGGDATHFSFWDQLAAGGTYYGQRPSSASSDQTFNSSGELEVTAATGTATTTP